MKNLILPLLLALICSASCQSDSETSRIDSPKTKEKAQTIDEAFQTVHNSKGTDILTKLENKSKEVNEGDRRKTIIAQFKGDELSKTLSSLSSDNEVEIRKKGNKRQITLVSKSSFKERVTRFVLEFKKGPKETGSFEISGMSLYIETYKKEGASHEITSVESWIKGTIELYKNDDNVLKGTAKLEIPKLNFNKNGTTEKTSENVEIELGFHNANL